MNRVLVSIGGLMVGLLALLFVVPAIVDWNRYRGIFEEEATRFLGREVRVGGEVNLRLLPVPYVRFEKVRVADTAANVGKPLFMAEDFTVWLSVGALLAGGIEASAIELNKPVVTLVLDGQGGGSWSGLAPNNFASSLGTTRVAFDAFRITGGRIQILNASGRLRTSFDHINGELSATALEGPYKVVAAFAMGGAPRELRLSTAAPAADGAVRIKGSVRDPESGTSYSLDGLLRDALGRPRVSGELTARLPLPSVIDTAGKPGTSSQRRREDEFDVRAQLAANTSGLTLKDLSLSFEQAGRPQLANGEATVDWTESTDVKLSLRSHWLDLDRIAGGPKSGVSPIKLAERLAGGVSKVLKTEGHTLANLTIEQASLGGDVVSGLAVTLEEANNKLAIKELAASLPGGTRLSTSGAVDLAGKEPRFDGRINLRGASLSRFMGWAAKGQGFGPPGRDRSFALIGDVSIAANAISGKNISLQMGRDALTGEASWKEGTPRELVIDLEGSELDLSPIFSDQAPTASTIGQLLYQMAGKPAEEAPSGTQPPKPVQANIRLRVDRLLAGKTVFRDAATELKLVNGHLSVNEIRVASSAGYDLDIRGDIADLAKSNAKGALAVRLSTDTKEGIVAASRLLDLPAAIRDVVLAPDRLALMVPLRLAGRISLGSRGNESSGVTLDGALGSSRVSGSIRLGSTAGSWRERPADIAITIDGQDAARLAAGLGSTQAPATWKGESGTQVVIRGIGAPAAGLVTLASLTSKGFNSEFAGKASIDEKGGLGLNGHIDIAAADASNALRLLGHAPQPALSGNLGGRIELERKDGRFALSTERLHVAGTTASGNVRVEPAIEDGYRLVGDLKMERASFPGLLTALTKGREPPREAKPAGARQTTWSEAPMDLAVLDRLAGSKLRIEAASLAITSDIAVEDARLEFAARPGGLDLRLLESKALDGRVNGAIGLDRAPAGVRLNVEGRLSGAHLEKLTSGSAGAVGIASFTLKGDGTALTPRGLVAALTGAGELRLDRASLKKWDPASVGTAAEAIIGMQGPLPPGALRQQIELGLAKGGGVSLGSQRIAVKLADGALRIEPLAITTPNGNLTGYLLVDIDAQILDAQWRIEPKAAPPQLRPLPQKPPPSLVLPTVPYKPQLPAISIAYVGPPSKATTLEPRLDIDALEREVAVRKVEREVTELERIRRLDEELARLEAVRQEQIRLEEQRRLEELRRLEAARQATGLVPGAPGAPELAPPYVTNQPLFPPATGVSPGRQQNGTVNPPPATTAPAPSGSLPQPSGAAAPAPNALSPPLAVPPTTVEITPAPRPALRPAPPKTRRIDPFEALRNNGGGG